ncbi:MAG: MmcQ/YjbR family DNA-binding protein [Deltaproteobacteria bacterium]|nr:MmcQ/YjbR family DNA-binding protein [Deltaproteobacteria bacterium]
MKKNSNDPLSRVRQICLALPDATEKIAWGEPTFRIRDKMFAMFVNNHHSDGRVALWLKAEPGVQEIVVGAAPKRFFVPPYVGHKGWLGVRVDGDVDWEEVASFLEDAYKLIAPKTRRRPEERASRNPPAPGTKRRRR